MPSRPSSPKRPEPSPSWRSSACPRKSARKAESLLHGLVRKDSGEIMAAVSIPVMAMSCIGHFAEAQILQQLGVDYIDESEVLTPADNLITLTRTPSRSHSSVAPQPG